MTKEQALALAAARLRMQGPSAAAQDTAKWQEQIRSDLTGDMSMLDKTRAGFFSGISDLAHGIGQRIGMVDQSEIDERAKLNAPLMSTTPGAIANVAGKVATALPTMFIPGANTVAGSAAIGAGVGAAEPTQTGESVGSNIGYGALGGAAGQLGANALTRALRPVSSQLDPVTSQLAQSAQTRGIPLDAADLTGSRPLTVMRDVMSNLPMTADRQAALQGGKQSAFNRAVSRTFGENADAITPQVAQGARDRIGQQFTELSARNQASIGDDVVNKLGLIVEDANRFRTPDVANVVRNFADEVLSQVDQTGQISGRAYRQLDSQMGRTMRGTTNGDVRSAVGEVRDLLRGAMDSSISPADQAGWKQARQQYANLMTVAPLAARDEAGDVSGRALLAAALRSNKSAPFTGGGELGELGRIGKAFIAEQTPNSGTAQRTFYQNLLTNPVSTGMQAVSGGMALPLQKVMNTDLGKRYLSSGLLPISEKQRALAKALGGSTGMALPLYAE